jgi:hypothetical protein
MIRERIRYHRGFFIYENKNGGGDVAVMRFVKSRGSGKTGAPAGGAPCLPPKHPQDEECLST